MGEAAGTISVALKHLMAAGLQGDELLSAIAEIEATLPRLVIDGSAERRRARDRRYQADKRTGKKSAESADLPPNDSISNPQAPSETKVSSGAARPPKPKLKGSRLPTDFVVPEEWLVWAMERRKWTRSDAVAEGEKFSRHWKTKTGKDATKLDWFMTWQNWVDGSFRPDGTSTHSAEPFNQADYEARLERIGRRESTGPPRPIGDVAKQIVREASH